MKRNKQQAEFKVFRPFHQGVYDQVQKLAVSIPAKKVKFEAPYLIERNYKNRQIVNYNQDWDWKKDYFDILEIESKINPNFVKEYNKAVDETVELTIQNKMTPELMNGKISSISTLITSQIPRRCETDKALNHVETVFENMCISNKEFSTDQLKIELKKFTNHRENKKNTALDESEIESLSILILSTNYELDAVLRRIDGHIRENVIKIMKELVVSLLRSQNLNLIFISAEIDDKLEKLHQLQRSHSKYKHNLENIPKISREFRYNPAELFRIDITELFSENRDDIDFFELTHMNRLKPDNFVIYTNEGLLNVSSISIIGITPNDVGNYTYSMSMKYTYIKDASIINIPVLLTIIVGEECCGPEQPGPDNNPANVLSPKMLLLIFFLFLIVALLFCAIWYYKKKASRNNQIIQYNEEKPEEFGIFQARNVEEEDKKCDSFEAGQNNYFNQDESD